MIDLTRKTKMWTLWYPSYPGHDPLPQSDHDTESEAWEAGQAELRSRPDLTSQDVRIVPTTRARKILGIVERPAPSVRLVMWR